ncbi:hypothetical protein [Paenibacillus sp. Soil522]|uniref:hypothetical protein n=1 Tax=Paenibacillus sp. Soil522 TaxID=1736388 RepID=UPI0006F8A19C|nr:hypothetical protein [Paenibacillus sp. Soil522]KRE35124.1 hypothetical protein ASG81_21280 [Paenibacillus sp. Soil522]
MVIIFIKAAEQLLIISDSGGIRMRWVYWVRLYETKFQAGCLVRRMENDWWVYGYECPREVEVFKSRKGRFGVRFIP